MTEKKEEQIEELSVAGAGQLLTRVNDGSATLEESKQLVDFLFKQAMESDRMRMETEAKLEVERQEGVIRMLSVARIGEPFLTAILNMSDILAFGSEMVAASTHGIRFSVVHIRQALEMQQNLRPEVKEIAITLCDLIDSTLDKAEYEGLDRAN